MLEQENNVAFIPPYIDGTLPRGKFPQIVADNWAPTTLHSSTGFNKRLPVKTRRLEQYAN